VFNGAFMILPVACIESIKGGETLDNGLSLCGELIRAGRMRLR